MTNTVPLQREPMTISQDADVVVIGCERCAVALRLPLEPTTALLDAIGEFARDHAPCL